MNFVILSMIQKLPENMETKMKAIFISLKKIGLIIKHYFLKLHIIIIYALPVYRIALFI